MDKDLKNKTLDELEALAENFGQKKYLAKYIFTFIHSKDVGKISNITPLSKAFRNQLTEQGYYLSHLNTIRTLSDPDGTIKYLFELADGSRIEKVLLPDGKRKTLCVSTQAGCSMSCAFCATAKLGFSRNLTAAEIVDQINVIQKNTGKINNVVYMGMGEPLLNYGAVIKSIRILNHPLGKNIGLRHLTISTCGITEGIRKLADEDIHPRLAISLNAPTDSLRLKIMPINKKYPVAELMNAAKYYFKRTKNRLTFEYILIAGINDSKKEAEKLSRLVDGLPCKINIIPYNTTDKKYTHPTEDKINRFVQPFLPMNVVISVRRSKGSEINAACGQLYYKSITETTP